MYSSLLINLEHNRGVCTQVSNPRAARGSSRQVRDNDCVSGGVWVPSTASLQEGVSNIFFRMFATPLPIDMTPTASTCIRTKIPTSAVLAPADILCTLRKTWTSAVQLRCTLSSAVRYVSRGGDALCRLACQPCPPRGWLATFDILAYANVVSIHKVAGLSDRTVLSHCIDI